jgi:acyl phosphate:glycerol-3-phosphate acyltransferase
MELFFLIIATVAAYIIGFPYSYIAGNLIKGVDLRKQGSGNLGTSNALRVLGKKAGAAVLVADLLKGVLVVLVLPQIFFRSDGIVQRELFTALVAAAVIAGHNWPALLKFKGGKGVAVTLGVFLAVAPVPTLLSLSVLIILIAATRFISLGSIVFGLLLAPLMIAFNYNRTLAWLGVAAAVSIIVQHRSNIKRLVQGNENKLGRSKGNV